MQTRTSVSVLLIASCSISNARLMWPEFVPPFPDFGLVQNSTKVPLKKIIVDSHVKGNVAHSSMTFEYKNEYNGGDHNFPFFGIREETSHLGWARRV